MGIGWYLNRRRMTDAILATSVTSSCIFLPSAGIDAFDWVPYNDVSAVYLSIFGTSATLLGFVVASATFLAAHTRSPEFTILRNSQSYNQLFAIFNSATWRLAALMILTATLSRSSAKLVELFNIIVLLTACYTAPALMTLFWATLRILKVRTPT